MISCCAVEYATAVSVGTLQHVSSASAFVACVMPAAPGVTDATFASDPEPDHPHDRLERDRDREPGEEDRDDAELAQPGEEGGEERAEQVLTRVGEDRATLLRLVPELLHLAPEDPSEHDDQDGAPDDDHDHRHGVILEAAEVQVEAPRDREEEIEVDERPGDREEDLLHEVRGDRAAEGRGRDDRHEHQERHERADVRGQEAVHRDTDRVRGDDRRDPHLARIGKAEDPVVREPRECRLRGLEGDASDDRLRLRGRRSGPTDPRTIPATSTPIRSRNATATMTATIAAPTFRSRRMRLSGGGTSTGMVPAIASLNVQPLLPGHTTGADTVDVRPGG